MTHASLRQRLWRAIEPGAWPGPGLSPLNRAIVAAILIGVVVSILATEPLLGRRVLSALGWVEVVLGTLFAVEYAARLWVAAEQDPSRPPWANRLAFVCSPFALVDLLILLVTIAPAFGLNLMALRMLRLLRILSLAKLGRMSGAFNHLIEAVASRRYELMATICLAAVLLILGASALHWIEGDLQPEEFGSIPRSLWWAVVTLTTIGYGDVYPVTALGKLVASVIAVIGIGVIALPTGILAAAFSDAVQRQRTKRGD